MNPSGAALRIALGCLTTQMLSKRPSDSVPLDGVPLDGVPLDGLPLDRVFHRMSARLAPS